MAEQGLGGTYHSLEVPIHVFGTKDMLRPPPGVENQLTSPKTIEDFMRKSVQFGYGRTGSYCSISTSGGANT
jgi:hypothetical protein